MKEIKSIVLRNSKDDDVVFVGREETINDTNHKIIISFTDGTEEIVESKEKITY